MSHFSLGVEGKQTKAQLTVIYLVDRLEAFK